MVTQRGPKDGDATRARLVATAEQLFAEHGIGAVSVRQINKEAGLGAASVHYHFGSKEALLDAVVRRHSEPVVTHFLQNVKSLLKRKKTPTARDLVEAWAGPVVAVLDEDRERGALWLQVTTRLPSRDLNEVWGPEVGIQWSALIERAFPQVSSADRVRGWILVTVTLPHLLSRAPRGSSPEEAQARAAYIEGCLEFAARGLAGFMASVRQT